MKIPISLNDVKNMWVDENNGEVFYFMKLNCGSIYKFRLMELNGLNVR